MVELEFGGENQSNWEETFPSATLPTTGLGSNRDLRDKKESRRHVKQAEEATCDLSSTK